MCSAHQCRFEDIDLHCDTSCEGSAWRSSCFSWHGFSDVNASEKQQWKLTAEAVGMLRSSTRFQQVESCASTCQLKQEVTDNQQLSALWRRREGVSFKFWEGAHGWHCSSQHKWLFFCHSLFISDFASAQANQFIWIPCSVCSCILKWHLLIWMQLNSTSNPYLRQFCQTISGL